MGLGVIFLEGIRYFYKLIFKDNTKDESNITSENKKISEKRIENVKSENLREVQTEKLSNKPGRVSGNNTFKVSNLSESDSEIYKNSMVIGILVTLVGIVISIPFIIGSIFSNNNLSNTKPQDSSTKPKDSPTKPQDSPTKPHDSSTKPQDNPKKPHDSTTKPQDSPTKPHDSSTKPHDSPTKPHDSSTKPQDNPKKPHDNPTKPHDSPTKPHDSPTKPNDSPIIPKQKRIPSDYPKNKTQKTNWFLWFFQSFISKIEAIF